jgi:hypothetical protein
MTSEIIQRKKLTWNKAVALVFFALFAGPLAGIWMLKQRIFLAPPLAAGSQYFYMAVGLLPALVTLFIASRAQSMGKRLILVTSSMFGCLIVFFYLIVIGPAIYTDIQCQARVNSGLFSHLECICQFESSGSKIHSECSADKLLLLPFLKVVDEDKP